MENHGIARTARSRTEEQRQQDLEKIKQYRSLEDQVREKIAEDQYGQDTFQLTSKLLRLNPEYYTIWNARRRCLISGLFSKRSDGLSSSTELPSSSVNAIPTPSSADSLPSSSTETPQTLDSQITGTSGTTPDAVSKEVETWQKQDAQLIEVELGFTIPLLIQFPKSYWIWNYRGWILLQAIERLPLPVARKIWQEELGLVSKMLSKDRRNYHAWGYRRRVVAQLESPQLDGKSMVESEFEYTTKKIHEDLSNFSAWHSRSQLIPRLLNMRQADDDDRKRFIEGELELVRNALNVGPEDQSLWFYHQYLISNLVARSGRSTTIVPGLTAEERESYIRRELVDIKDLLEDYDGIKWIYEALIDDTLAIYQLRGQELDGEEKSDVAQWLQQLRALDPKRSGRWEELQIRVAA